MAELKLIETIQTKLPTLAQEDGQLIVIRDNASLYIDLDGARIYISDWIDVPTDTDRLAMLSPLSNKYYYVVETNKIWRYISGSWVLVTQNNYEDLINKPKIEGVELIGNKTLSDFGGKKQIRISWDDYQALPTEEQNDESIVYYIYDYPNNVVNASDVSYDNTSSGLSATNIQDGIDELNSNFNNYYSLKDAIEIPEGADLDDYTEFGNYVCGGTVSKTLINYPLSNTPAGIGFVLKVERSAFNMDGFCRQTIKTYNGIAYERILNNGVWGEWQRDFPMPLKMKMYQQTITPDSEGKVSIDVSELNASGGFAFCTPLGNQNAVVTVSALVDNGKTVNAYVKNISTGGAFTNDIFITAYVFYAT